MSLDTRAVATLLRAELRMLLRDRRTIVLSVVLPLLFMPIMLFGSRIMQSKRERTLQSTVFLVAVTGSEAAAARDRLAATAARLAARAASKPDTLKIREATVDDPAKALEDGRLHLVVEATTAEEAAQAAAARRAAKPASEPTQTGGRGEDRDEEKPSPGVPVLNLVFRADRDTSVKAMVGLRDALRESRDLERAALLRGSGFPVPVADVAAVTETDVASAGQVAGLTLGRLLTLMLLMFIMSGGAVVATDTLAGEKERGTLETLLATAAGRLEIVTAKQLAILTVSLGITLIQVVNFLVYVGFKLIPTSQDFAAAVPPSLAVLLFVLYVPVAALASAVLLLTSGYARSYKEAQLYFFPVFLLGMLPALAPFLPGLALRSAIVVVPVANIAVAVKEVLTGTYDWPMIALAFVCTAAAAVWVTRLTARALDNERLISPAHVEPSHAAGGAGLFSRHVTRWFAVMWAAVLIVSVNQTEDTDLRLQLLINLGVIFLGGTLLMLRRYRLEPREALALRPVRPVVWLAVVCGAPSALLTGIGVARLANLVVPVPPKVLEAFGQALLPDTIPFWQILVLLTVAPGIIEELAFRGVLLYGLARRLHPAVAALAVGAVFGLFHVSLFRLAPTAFLGVLFAAVTMLTGSIFPAMLWHALNNAAGVLAGHYGVGLADLPVPLYLAGAAVLALCLWILWRTRTPYPGLRPWRRGRA